MKKDKLAQLIQVNVSEIIQFSLKNPKIGFITVTDVVITADGSQAKVYVSFLGKQERNDAGMKALEKSKGFIRSELAKKLSVYKVPELIFLRDESLEKGNRIEELLRKVSNN